MPGTATQTARPLTDTQLAILRFIVRHLGEHQSPPSIREIGEEFGIKSPNGVMSHLKPLAKKGHIVLGDKLARGMRVPALDAAFRKAADDYLATLEGVR